MSMDVQPTVCMQKHFCWQWPTTHGYTYIVLTLSLPCFNTPQSFFEEFWWVPSLEGYKNRLQQHKIRSWISTPDGRTSFSLLLSNYFINLHTTAQWAGTGSFEKIDLLEITLRPSWECYMNPLKRFSPLEAVFIKNIHFRKSGRLPILTILAENFRWKIRNLHQRLDQSIFVLQERFTPSWKVHDLLNKVNSLICQNHDRYPLHKVQKGHQFNIFWKMVPFETQIVNKGQRWPVVWRHFVAAKCM